MLIIPAIDLIDGQCVRLKQGDYSRQTVYSNDPVAVAKSFSDEGAEWIHIVDLNGAKAGKPQNLHVVKEIADSGVVRSKIEFGGGLSYEGPVEDAFNSSVSRVVLGSALTKSPEFSKKCFALGEKVVAGIDTKDGRVAVHGWLDSTQLDGIEFAKALCGIGCCRIIWTDIATDGMLSGPNLEGLERMVRAVSVPIIARGGVSTLDDLKAIRETGAEGAIVGKAIYEGRFTVAEAIAAVV